MSLARVDQHHLARANVAFLGAVVEMKSALGDDQSDRDRVAVLWHLLTWLQPEPDNAHRPAVGDLLETKRPMGPARAR
jgi:hypothetical protein